MAKQNKVGVINFRTIQGVIISNPDRIVNRGTRLRWPCNFYFLNTVLKIEAMLKGQ